MADIQLTFTDGVASLNEVGIGNRVLFDVLNNKVTGIQIIANKVLKKLLTSYNTDAYAPESGSDFKQYLQGSPASSDLSRMATEISGFFAQVTADIQEGETAFTNTIPEEGLASINLINVKNIDDTMEAKGVLVEFSIVTTKGNRVFAKLDTSNLNSTSSVEDDLLNRYLSIQTKINGIAEELERA